MRGSGRVRSISGRHVLRNYPTGLGTQLSKLRIERLRLRDNKVSSNITAISSNMHYYFVLWAFLSFLKETKCRNRTHVEGVEQLSETNSDINQWSIYPPWVF
jgi:hypothetical protein